MIQIICVVTLMVLLGRPLQHVLCWCRSLRFSTTRGLWSLKAAFTIAFSLPLIIITITSNKPWNTETYKTDQNPPIINHKPWPFERVKVNLCFLRGPLRWLAATKNANVSWLLNFRIHVLMKSAVMYAVVREFILMNFARASRFFVHFFARFSRSSQSIKIGIDKNQ